MSKIHVGNLDKSVTEEELREEFRRFGPIRHIFVAKRPPGFAFIEFDDRRDAEDAIHDMHDRKLFGARVTVEWSRPRGGSRGGSSRDGGSSSSRDGGRDSRDRPYETEGDIRCFNCNGYGHYAKDCPKPRNTGECYVCQKRGHQARDCPERGGSGGRGRSTSRSRSRSRRDRSRSRSRSRRDRSRSRDRRRESRSASRSRRDRSASPKRDRSASPKRTSGDEAPKEPAAPAAAEHKEPTRD